MCAACGAVERTMDVSLIRFAVWCNTIGLVLLIWLAQPYFLYKELQSPITNWKLVALSSVVMVGGFWVYKAATWIWAKVLGRMSDKKWYR